MFDIGRVFATSLAMLRQRFWPLVGMWAVFLAIQMAATTVLTVVMAVIGMAGAAATGLGGLEDPAGMTGLGIGIFLFMLVFYAAYLVLLLAQQAAMVTLASPLEQPVFGTAMMRGFRSCLPFLAISMLLVAGYGALAVAVLALAGGLELASSGAGGPVAVITVLATMPLMVFLACRFAVLVPVVAVDQVFNPIAAIRRCWAVTRGKVLRILAAMIGFAGLSLAAMVLPFALIFVGAWAGGDNPGVGIAAAIIGILMFIPLIVIYTVFTATFMAALHCEVTGGGAERLEDVFA